MAATVRSPVVATAIETTTKPLRGARQLFEEVEEIHFSLRRTHRVSVVSDEQGPVVAYAERQQMLTDRDERPQPDDPPRQLPRAK